MPRILIRPGTIVLTNNHKASFDPLVGLVLEQANDRTTSDTIWRVLFATTTAGWPEVDLIPILNLDSLDELSWSYEEVLAKYEASINAVIRKLFCELKRHTDKLFRFNESLGGNG